VDVSTHHRRDRWGEGRDGGAANNGGDPSEPATPAPLPTDRASSAVRLSDAPLRLDAACIGTG